MWGQPAPDGVEENVRFAKVVKAKLLVSSVFVPESHVPAGNTSDDGAHWKCAVVGENTDARNTDVVRTRHAVRNSLVTWPTGTMTP